MNEARDAGGLPSVISEENSSQIGLRSPVAMRPRVTKVFSASAWMDCSRYVLSWLGEAADAFTALASVHNANLAGRRTATPVSCSRPSRSLRPSGSAYHEDDLARRPVDTFRETDGCSRARASLEIGIMKTDADCVAPEAPNSAPGPASLMIY